MKNKFFFWCRNFEGLLPSLYCERKRKKKKICIAIQFCIAENEACRCLGCIAIGWRLYCKKGRWGAGERAGAHAGRAWGAQVAPGRWASGRAAGARDAQDARGARQERQAIAWQADAGQGRGSSAQATGGRRAGRHGVGGQGRAAGCTMRTGHDRPGRGLGAGWVRRLGQLGQFWCTVHLAQFWLGFWTRFDSVFS